MVSISLRRVSIAAGFFARVRDKVVKVLEVVSNPAAIKAMPYVKLIKWWIKYIL